MALGKDLRTARLNRRLTVSQVAAQTRVKAQLIDAIEREDFSKIAAPIYAKGFIKLFAECVGLDPKPLLDEYVTGFVPVKIPVGFEADNFVVNSDGSVTRKLVVPLPEIEEPEVMQAKPVAAPVAPVAPPTAQVAPPPVQAAAEPVPSPAPTRRQARPPKPAPVDDAHDLFSYSQNRPAPAPAPERTFPAPVTDAAADTSSPAPAPAAVPDEPVEVPQAVFDPAPAPVAPSRRAAVTEDVSFSRSPARFVVLIMGAILLAALLISGIYRLFVKGTSAPNEPTAPTADLATPPSPDDAVSPVATSKPPLRIAIEPSAPYVE